jgi:hypothetical protein
MNAEIVTYNTTISGLKSNQDIASYDIVMANKDSIAKDIETSKAQKYINEILAMSKKYNMNFSGFSFEGAKVNTVATYTSRTGDSIK